MPQFGAQIDTMRIPIKGLIAEQSATALATPVEGLLWHDTANKLYKIYLNGTWMTIANAAAGISDGDKGDITVSGGGTVWTIDNGTITSPKIADGTIVDVDIAPTAAIQGAKLQNASVTQTQLANGSVGSAQIIDGTIVVGDTATAFDLGALATAHPTTTDVAMNSMKITGLASPVSNTDAANKLYVDTWVQGLDAKNSCRAATTANITLSGLQTVDGVALAIADRVLVKNQTTAAQNGIYLANSSGWTRSVDMDAPTEVPGAFTFVEEGTTQADTGWVVTSDAPINLNVTAINWTQFSGAGQIIAGAGMTKTGNTLDVVGGTGLVVAADLVSLDTTYTDGRYWNTTGPDSATGMFTINAGAGNGIKVLDQVQNLETRHLSDRYAFYNSGGTWFGGLSCDPANSVETLSATTGYTLALSAPKITVSQNPATATEVANKAYVDSQAPSRYCGSVGALTAGVETVITHNLGKTCVIAQFHRVDSTPANQEIFLSWRTIDNNSIGVTADVALASISTVILG